MARRDQRGKCRNCRKVRKIDLHKRCKQCWELERIDAQYVWTPSESTTN